MPLGWCGTGLEMRCLKKGTTQQFDVSWHWKVDAIKVCVCCQDSDALEADSVDIQSEPVNVKPTASLALTPAL